MGLQHDLYHLIRFDIMTYRSIKFLPQAHSRCSISYGAWASMYETCLPLSTYKLSLGVLPLVLSLSLLIACPRTGSVFFTRLVQGKKSFITQCWTMSARLSTLCCSHVSWTRCCCSPGYLFVAFIPLGENLFPCFGTAFTRDVYELVARVRHAVRFVRSLPAKFEKFKVFVHVASIQYKKMLYLNFLTRWDSTFFT